MPTQKHICIIGNGIAGITAARHIRKLSDHPITIISSESTYFYSRTALMYIYMGHMKFEHTKPYEDWFWAKNRLNLVQALVEKVDFSNKKILLSTSESIDYDDLILAIGSKSNRFGWPGQDLKGVQGLYSIQDLEAMEANTQGIKKAIIVGGGLIGVEMAEMLISRKIKVTFLARESNFWDNVLPLEEAQLIEREIKKHGIDLRLNSELAEIIGDETNKVVQIKTKANETIDCEFLGITVGVSPNIDFLKNTDLEVSKGILVNEYLQTNLPNVYAIGDCVEHQNPPEGRRNIEQIWYSGKIMGETLAQTICGNHTQYEPGIFYNSAKFFDIEYSVYGSIPNNLPDNVSTFYWENKAANKCLRINFDIATNQIVGIHAFGIRIRQSIAIKWIKNKNTIASVLSELEKVNFDAEFSKTYFSEIQESATI
ncbi:MAG: FAD-dependent oxidoreductase [Bacteroidota bacterium]